MRRKGNCDDNAAVEGFFKSLKAEISLRRNWLTRREVEVAIFNYRNGSCKPHRGPCASGWKGPEVFKRNAA